MLYVIQLKKEKEKEKEMKKDLELIRINVNRGVKQAIQWIIKERLSRSEEI